ncbi:MAG: hypothetical protein LUI02_06265 [Clostridiales bacterium]|nr:hypothetical protein [Clostridiales bacterium]
MSGFKNFLTEEDGMGTVEIILIIVVLIALVTLFSGQIRTVVSSIMEKITSGAGDIEVSTPTT